MKHYKVIAEVVDKRSGERLAPGDVMQGVDDDTAKRLIRARCLHPDPVPAPAPKPVQKPAAKAPAKGTPAKGARAGRA